MSSEVKRSQRVAERIRQEISLLLRALGDPRIAGAVVTRVEVTDDLSFVRVFVRRDVGATEAERKVLLRGLDAALGKIRRDVTRNVQLRVAPSLRFLYDEGVDAQHRIEEILQEIAAEQPDRSSK